MYLRHGDIVIMSGGCRLAYHAIPRVLHDQVITEELIGQSEDMKHYSADDSQASCRNDCQGASNNVHESDSIDENATGRGKEDIYSEHCPNMSDWLDYANYLSRNRVNMNIRQVFKKK